jgi:hypothetical protein
VTDPRIGQELAVIARAVGDDGELSNGVYAIARALNTSETHEGDYRTAGDTLHALATGAHRIADALELIADALEKDESEGDDS